MNELTRQFRGEQLRSVEVNGLALVESRFCRGGGLPRHRHHNAFISFLLAGAQIQRLPSEERCCSAASVVWHPEGEVHEDRFSSDGHILFLAFQDEWLKSLPSGMRLLHQGRKWEGGLLYRLGLDLYQGLNRGRTISQETATDIVSSCISAGRGHESTAWLIRVLEWMNDAWSENLSLDQAATVAGVHPVHVSRTFRRFQGCTFREHLTLIRLRRATDLLKRSRLPVTEIALACGFSDHAHFTRTFKQITGITPTAYRRQTG